MGRHSARNQGRHNFPLCVSTLMDATEDKSLLLNHVYICLQIIRLLLFVNDFVIFRLEKNSHFSNKIIFFRPKATKTFDQKSRPKPKCFRPKPKPFFRPKPQEINQHQKTNRAKLKTKEKQKQCSTKTKQVFAQNHFFLRCFVEVKM